MFIVGTAGHIDHGKTTLVRSLTGIDTDRLKEEKERGISIELGFAYLDLGGHQRIGLIDVPGHERFVHHMIAGATGVDVVMLVVAADEGVMPQTREHLAICELLGMTRGLVVLTKTDLVEPDWLELVKDDVRKALSHTFLRQAPIVEFSAMWPADRMQVFRTQLVGGLQTLAAAGSRLNTDRPLLLPVDRVFSVKGFGTVVTGTIQTGQVSVGDDLVLLPEGNRTRVRRIEVHGASVAMAPAGSRAALNLPEITREELQRGAVLAHQGTLEPTRELMGQLELLPTLPGAMRRQFKALFHTGSSMAEATVRLQDPKELQPGERGLVSIHLEAPVAVLSGQRFVVRGFTTLADYGKTLGGGVLLWPKFVRPKPRNLERLEHLLDGKSESAVDAASYLAGPNGISARSLPAWTPLPASKLKPSVDKPPATVRKVGAQGLLLHDEYWGLMVTRITDLLKAYHAENPRKPGMPKEELKSKLPAHIDRQVVDAVLTTLVQTGTLRTDELTLGLPAFAPRMDARFVELQAAMVDLLLKTGLEPPERTELLKSFKADQKDVAEALAKLVQEGQVTRITSEYFVHTQVFQDAKTRLVEFLKANGLITTQQMKEMFGLSRKYLIPLAEFFDGSKVTLRVGNAERKLRGS